MNCPSCGLLMLIRVEREVSEISETMNEQRRIRVCANAHRTETVEVCANELRHLQTFVIDMTSRVPA